MWGPKCEKVRKLHYDNSTICTRTCWLHKGNTIRQEHAGCMKAIQLDKNMLVV